MTNAAEKLLADFKSLTEQAQQEVLSELLRLPIELPYAAPTDQQLLRVADAVFLALDRREEQS